MFTKIREIYDKLKLNEELRTGFLYYEVEDQYLKVDDSRIGTFYIRESADRFGDNISLNTYEETGCADGYEAISNYVIVFQIDKCLLLEKSVKVLLYQIADILGAHVTGIGTDARAIYAVENKSQLTRVLPFHLIKFTIQVRETIDDIRLCESLTLCRADCC